MISEDFLTSFLVKNQGMLKLKGEINHISITSEQAKLLSNEHKVVRKKVGSCP